MRRRLLDARKLVRLLGVSQTARFALAKLLRLPVVRLHVKTLPSALFCRTNYSDIRVLWQVFGSLDLDIPMASSPQLLIDAGANVGYTTAYLAHRFPEARIVAIEPDADNCRMIRRNCTAYANVDLIEGAIWPREARLAISNPDAQSWAFQVREAENAGGIGGVTVQGILQRTGLQTVDLLKIDIEGAEERLFRDGPENWLDAVNVLAVEVHGGSARAAIDGALAGADFDRTMHGEKLILTRRGRGSLV